MRTLLTTAVISAGFLASVGPAFAATFDFASDAVTFQTTETFEGTFDQVYLDSDSVLYQGNTVDGITVTASAFTADQGEADPFMDSLSSQRPAGLGVCSTGFDGDATEDGSGDFDGMSRCSTQYSGSPRNTGDDNLSYPEFLKLSFSTDVFITELFVRDADHFPVGDDGIAMNAIEINGSFYDVLNGYVQGLAGLASSSMFTFTSGYVCSDLDYSIQTDNGPSCQATGQIYLSTLTATPVPLPAAGWLLLGGLGGLAAMKRRRKS